MISLLSGPPRSPKKILFADEIKKDNNPEIELEEPTIAESVASDVTEGIVHLPYFWNP